MPGMSRVRPACSGALTPSALEPVDDFAADRMRAAEQTRRVGDLAGVEQLAHPRRGHATPGVDGTHVIDDVDLEAEFAAQFAQELGVARATATEAEVGADHHDPHA